jgi:hypothetical protein
MEAARRSLQRTHVDTQFGSELPQRKQLRLARVLSDSLPRTVQNGHGNCSATAVPRAERLLGDAKLHGALSLGQANLSA